MKPDESGRVRGNSFHREPVNAFNDKGINEITYSLRLRLQLAF